MPKVSIIIPVYNVEDYLVRCLESVNNQTFEDFEVILLNDGSTDTSGQIAKEYCEAHARFLYFEHTNIGLGPTRNRGINLATGEYITFVDSDDFLETNAIEILLELIETTKTDVSCGNIRFVFDNSKDNFKRNSIQEDHSIDLSLLGLQNFAKDYYLKGVHSYNAVDKLYRRKFIVDNKILFGDNKEIFAEDNYYQLRIILNKPKISYTNKVIYNYYQRSTSIMNNFKFDLIQRQMKMVEILDNQNNHSRDDFFIFILTPLVLETIIMEALNLKNEVNKYSLLKDSMAKLREYELFYEALDVFLENKIYQEYRKRTKKTFLLAISLLEKHHMIKLSNKLISIVYFKREK